MAKCSKYGNVKTVVEGIKFDSGKEALRYKELKLLQQAGRICDLKLQVRIPLMGLNGQIRTPKGGRRSYRADFTYYEIGNDGKQVYIVEDVKGYKTQVYELKRDILAASGIIIRET